MIGISAGAIAGIVITLFIVLVAFAFGFGYFFYQHRKLSVEYKRLAQNTPMDDRADSSIDER
jgi:cell division protein FtsL